MKKTDDNASGAPAFGKFERKLAARYLGARKSEGGVGLIAFLAFLCIMLAIWAMITIMSIMNGFRGTTIKLTLGTDGHMFVATPSANPTPEHLEALRVRLEAVDGVKVAFPYVENETFVQASADFTGAKVIGIPPKHLFEMKLISDNVYLGSLDTFGGGHNGGDQVAIGGQMAARLGLTTGDRITIFSPLRRTSVIGSNITRKSYEISAIFDTGLFVADNFNIYMPLQQASLFFEGGRSPTEIQLRLDSADLIHKLRQPIQDAAGEPVWIATWEDKNKTTATALRTEQIAMRFIFMIVVIIAVFPVLASMIMLVKNKSKDIAILRTMGASSGSVLRVFLMSGAAIGMLGTLFGIIIGILFCLNIGPIQHAIEFVTGTELFPADVYGLDKLPVKIVPMEVFLVSLWGFVISALATFFPAWTASKIDPVEALRYE